jgi:glutathione S-transferase
MSRPAIEARRIQISHAMFVEVVRLPGASMKVYSGPLSLFSKKVEIALTEKGLAFERVLVPFSQERGYAPKNQDVLAANPRGQVPVLIDGALALYDSTVIFEYLEDAYPKPPLYPAAPGARAVPPVRSLCG